MAEKFEYTREWTDAKAFPLLGFTKSWENPEDYPTIELDETQVRKDMQSLHDEVKNYINDKLIPAVLAEDATEAARAAAEAQRETNETQRIENENARIAAEQSRTTAESARADAETERAAAESARNTAEQAREAAEQARADETAGIVAQATEQAVIASNAASEASSSASGASTSASAAAASASSASDSASASASSATAAQASADEALSSKNSAKSEADRAKSEADRAAEIASGDFVRTSEKGAVNGVATLGADKKLTATQVPMQQIMAVTNAAEYSSAATYSAGAYCTHDGKLYRCTTAITEAEAWTAAHWTETSVAAELEAIYTTLAKKADLGEDGKVPAEQVDAYSKENSISAATRTALGLAETATPDAALAKMAQQLSSILTVETVSYTQMSSWVASGYALSDGNAYRFYDGTVMLYANINTNGSLTRGKTLMTIPEGYRPKRQLKFSGATHKSGSDEHPIVFELEPNGTICSLVSESNSVSAYILLCYTTGGVIIG